MFGFLLEYPFNQCIFNLLCHVTLSARLDQEEETTYPRGHTQQHNEGK